MTTLLLLLGLALRAGAQAPPTVAREFRGLVGRDRRQHRLAVEARAQYVGSAAGAARDPEPRDVAQDECDRVPHSSGRGRLLRFEARALVAVSHREARTRARAGVGSARVRGAGVAQTRTRAARVVQS